MGGNWVIPDFCYSDIEKLTEFGALGLIGELTLPALEGDIVEIGSGNSSMYLSFLARKFKRKIYYCDWDVECYQRLKAIPDYLMEEGTFYVGKSDDFFKDIKLDKVALAFIDGDHRYEQVKRDFENLIPYMVSHGIICLHDTFPPVEHNLMDNFCSNSYLLRQDLQRDDRFDCFTWVHTGSCKFGLTMVRVRDKNAPYYQQ